MDAETVIGVSLAEEVEQMVVDVCGTETAASSCGCEVKFITQSRH